MRRGKRIASLKAEKKKLLMLIKKKAIIRGRKRQLREEEAKLKSEVMRLKKISVVKIKKKNKLLTKLMTKARSPETKERLRKGKTALKKFGSAVNKALGKLEGFGENL